MSWLRDLFAAKAGFNKSIAMQIGEALFPQRQSDQAGR